MSMIFRGGPASSQQAVSAQELDLMGAFFGVSPEQYERSSRRARAKLMKEALEIRKRAEDPDEKLRVTFSEWREMWGDWVPKFTDEPALYPQIVSGVSALDWGEMSAFEKDFSSLSEGQLQVGAFLNHLAFAGWVWRATEYIPPSLLLNVQAVINDNELAEFDQTDIVSLAYRVAATYDTRPKGSHVPAQLLVLDFLLEATRQLGDGSQIPGSSVYAAFHFGMALKDINARYHYVLTSKNIRI
jgi:hypothetical protein